MDYLMDQKSFSDIGVVGAIDELYGLSAYKRVDSLEFRSPKGGAEVSAQRMFLEGLDFNLVYFPLKHLGYKCVVEATGELYAAMAHPRTLSLVLGVSAKLDFPQVRDIWMGAAVAAKEHGYDAVKLDLQPSGNGLYVSVSAFGERSQITSSRRPEPKSKDLICVSGPLGAAYLGLRMLEKGAEQFASGKGQPDMSAYKMIIGDYLRPELDSSVVAKLEDAGIYPSRALFVTRGLADALKRISRSTGLGAKVYADKIPFEGNSFQLGKELDIDPVSAAMNGGDDCRLLLVVPILSMEKFRRDFQTFDIIGHLALPEAGVSLVTPDGLEMEVKAQGWPDAAE
jgi:thiamine-monophosphate kinase